MTTVVNGSRVVHITTVHEWHDSRVFSRECRSLAQHGHEVVLLAVADREREVDGVRIVPVAQPRRRLGRIAGSIPRVASAALAQRAALYHLHDPELIPLIPLLRLRGAKVIYDAHEDFGAQILEKEYLPSAIRPAVAATRPAAVHVRRPHRQPHPGRLAEGRRGVPGGALHGGPQLPRGAARGRRRARLRAARAPRGLRGRADPVPRRRADGGRDAARRAAGRLAAAAGRPAQPGRPGRPAARAARLGRTWSTGARCRRRRPGELMSECRIGLALLQPIGQYVDVLPTKLFEYMSLGIPVVASDYPQCREVVQSAGCGLVVDPTDPLAIGAAITELAADPERAKAMGERGRMRSPPLPLGRRGQGHARGLPSGCCIRIGSGQAA